ncbi:MAG: hypothetical protein BroJett011_76300 [Chloroflexota bacterium]|nr:MAG: hypothetical protein BroJett011_76300 [Chloroflexota bacterium]
MDTILNPVNVPGWDQLLREHPTRAHVLQALTNLELAYYFLDGPALPTRKTILAEAIRLGAELSPTSGQAVQRHLDELVQAGHAIKLDKGRSPWKSRYLVLPRITQ